jgi:hypothetical protein
MIRFVLKRNFGSATPNAKTLETRGLISLDKLKARVL